MRWAQIGHRWLIRLMMAGVALQFFLAGAGAFFATDFDVHRAVGYALIPVGAVAFSFAAAARRHRVMTLVALVLLGVQAALGVIAADSEP